MKNIIVIGANGHVGAYAFDYLLENLNSKEYHLIASGRRDAPYYREKGVEYIKLDVCNVEDFNRLPQKDVYAVVNLAGIMPAAMKGYDPYPYIDINIRGSLNVLEYCRKVGCKKIIITTTEADLSGYWKPGACIDPDLPANFDHGTNYAMYIISRRTVLEMLENYRLRYNIKPFAIRCSTVYCYTESPYMYKLGKRIIPGYIQIYQKAMKGETIEVWGDPKVKTDIVYVKDFAQIVEKMIVSETAGGGIYNLGNGMPVSLEDQIKIAVEVFGDEKHKSKIVYRPDLPNGRDFIQDISKTCKELGYVPKYDYRPYLEDYKLEMERNRFHGFFPPRSEE